MISVFVAVLGGGDAGVFFEYFSKITLVGDTHTGGDGGYGELGTAEEGLGLLYTKLANVVGIGEPEFSLEAFGNGGGIFAELFGNLVEGDSILEAVFEDGVEFGVGGFVFVAGVGFSLDGSEYVDGGIERGFVLGAFVKVVEGFPGLLGWETGLFSGFEDLAEEAEEASFFQFVAFSLGAFNFSNAGLEEFADLGQVVACEGGSDGLSAVFGGGVDFLW